MKDIPPPGRVFTLKTSRASNGFPMLYPRIRPVETVLQAGGCKFYGSIYYSDKEIVMRVDRNLAYILLAVYLILAGLAALGLSASILSIIMGICALLAGIIFLITR